MVPDRKLTIVMQVSTCILPGDRKRWSSSMEHYFRCGAGPRNRSDGRAKSRFYVGGSMSHCWLIKRRRRPKNSFPSSPLQATLLIAWLSTTVSLRRIRHVYELNFVCGASVFSRAFRRHRLFSAAEYLSSHLQASTVLCARFDHLSADLADASSWERRFHVTVIGDREICGHRDVVLRLVQRVRGQIDHQDVAVNPKLWKLKR